MKSTKFTQGENFNIYNISSYDGKSSFEIFPVVWQTYYFAMDQGGLKLLNQKSYHLT